MRQPSKAQRNLDWLLARALDVFLNGDEMDKHSLCAGILGYLRVDHPWMHDGDKTLNIHSPEFRAAAEKFITKVEQAQTLTRVASLSRGAQVGDVKPEPEANKKEAQNG